MTNIYEILSKRGITVPEENRGEFEKDFFENYKTVAEVGKMQSRLSDTANQISELQKKYDDDIAARDTDLSTLKAELEKANGDGNEVIADLRNKLAGLTDTYAKEKADYEKKLTAQQYEFLVKERVNDLKFTSASAKRAFTHDVLKKGLPVEDGKLLGFEDYLNSYKEQDSGAFATEEKTEPVKPQFVSTSTKMDSPAPTVEKKIPRLL